MSATACGIEPITVGDRPGYEMTVAYPDETHAGAKPLRAAVEGRSLEDAAEDSPELAVALDQWGTETPR